MFFLDDKVVYPGHGVAKINRIVEKMIASSIVQFFELRFLNRDMTILVPIRNVNSVGIRKLSSQEHVVAVFKLLAEPIDYKKITPDLAASNWNKRHKEYQCKLRTGDLQEICQIYRDLNCIAQQKELSFGEKNLLAQTETLLVEEISIVNKVTEDKTTECLRAIFKPRSQHAVAQSL
jgi:CarD family transcriptional regulator